MEELIKRISEIAEKQGALDFQFKYEYVSRDKKTWYVIFLYFTGYSTMSCCYDFESCINDVIFKADEKKKEAINSAKKLLESA